MSSPWEEGVLGGQLAQAADLSAEPLVLLGPFGQQLFTRSCSAGRGAWRADGLLRQPRSAGASRRRVTDSRCCLCAARGPILAFASSAILAWMASASPG